MPASEPFPTSQHPARPSTWRMAVVAAAALLGVTATGWVFWEQDLRYSLPTPRPANFHPVKKGAFISLAEIAPTLPADRRTTLLHFYNPGCPCSRFNADHVAALRASFGDRVRFILVAQVAPSAEPAPILRKVRQVFPGADVVADKDGQIAARCGVYSTPQAVILAPDGKLLYRGNYNVSRYCANPATEFARLVLAATLAGRAVPALPGEAITAYGCELPAYRIPALLSDARP